MKPLKSLDTNGWSKKDLVREAQLQTNAIQQLSAWLRLACSLLVIGIIVAYWGFSMGGGTGFGVLGIVLAVLGGIAALVLKIGTNNARRNVEAILDAAGINLEKAKQDSNKHHREQKMTKKTPSKEVSSK
ncbi:hypothetical protein [Olsenella sp. Marseille-QA0557]|uniref:hypothetical protein n=1 Tax=Olsenella sp. Marseille-QA0557 TaxID=3378782 RepID=UPI003D0B517C